MYAMFQTASVFNGDISKWDVSSVTNMNSMFYEASEFKQNLCGDAWVQSKASKVLIFFGSSGQSVCTVVSKNTELVRAV